MTSQRRCVRSSRPALRQALERLTEAEIECKRTGIPDEAVCARTLLQLAALAGRLPQ